MGVASTIGQDKIPPRCAPCSNRALSHVVGSILV